MPNPDDSLRDPDPYSRNLDRAKTKLSIYSKSRQSWAFLDPDSITWESYNSVDYFVITDQKIAILADWRDDPSIFDSFLETNEILYKITVKGRIEFRKAKTLREFKDVFSGGEEE